MKPRLDHTPDDVLLGELQERLARSKVVTDWVSAYHDGEALKTDEAALVAGCSAATIRRRAALAAENGKPIGVQFAKSVWIISLARLLDHIEHHDGKPARLAAETRTEKLLKTRAAPQLSVHSVGAATG